MAIDSQPPQESNAKGRVKCTPLRGNEYAERCAGATPTLKYNNLEEWLKDVSPFARKTKSAASGVCYDDTDERVVCLSQNSDKEVSGEKENVEVVRTFYTYRPNARSDIDIWYADGEFGFYEGLPKRVADLHATHINVEVRSPNPLEPVQRKSDQYRFFYLFSIREGLA